jgi:hypothetical protein
MPDTSFIEYFTDSVRVSQLQSGKTTRGKSWLAEETVLSIRRMAAEICGGQKSDRTISEDHARRLMERFEATCRRRRQDVPDALRPQIMQHLINELGINAKALKIDPGSLISVTVLHGAVGPELVAEYAHFADQPGIVKRAAKSFSRDRRELLRSTEFVVDELMNDPEFRDEFSHRPDVLRFAATKYPRDPRKFLRGLQGMIAELERDPEFADLVDTKAPRVAVMDHRSDPRKFMREVQNTLAELERDPEFASENRYFLMSAVVDDPTDARRWLRELRNDREERDRVWDAHKRLLAANQQWNRNPRDAGANEELDKAIEVAVTVLQTAGGNYNYRLDEDLREVVYTAGVGNFVTETGLWRLSRYGLHIDKCQYVILERRIRPGQEASPKPEQPQDPYVRFRPPRLGY